MWEKVHEIFRLSLKKWLYPGDNNSIAEVIGMAKEKKKVKTIKSKWCPYFYSGTVSTWKCHTLKWDGLKKAKYYILES